MRCFATELSKTNYGDDNMPFRMIQRSIQSCFELAIGLFHITGVYVTKKTLSALGTISSHLTSKCKQGDYQKFMQVYPYYVKMHQYAFDDELYTCVG